MNPRNLGISVTGISIGSLLVAALLSSNSLLQPRPAHAATALSARGARQQATVGGSGWRAESPARPGLLNPGDVVRVTLFGLYSPGGHDTFELHIAEDGSLPVPLVGPVPVKGLTSDRAAAAVSAAQAKANLQNDAIVVIGIVRSAAETRVKPAVIANGENLRITLFDITGPNDRLEVLAQTADDGTIVLPLVGALKLAGLTEMQADDAVRKAMRDKNIIENATVSVLRLDAEGQP